MSELLIREARPGDADALVGLIAQLQFQVDSAGVAERLQLLAGNDEPVLVAERGGSLVGMLDWHVMPTVHRPRPVGRIVTLVVDSKCRGQGIGTALMAQAEVRLRARGCKKMEVTSNMRLERAHAFYEGYGLERSSVRFAKDL